MINTMFFKLIDALSDKDNPKYVYVNIGHIEYFEAHGSMGTTIYLSYPKRDLWVTETPEDLLNKIAIYRSADVYLI